MFGSCWRKFYLINSKVVAAIRKIKIITFRKFDFGILYSVFVSLRFFVFECITRIRAAIAVPVTAPPIPRTFTKLAFFVSVRKTKIKRGGMFVRIQDFGFEILKSRTSISIKALLSERYAVNIVIIPRIMNGLPSEKVAISEVLRPWTPTTMSEKRM